MAALAACVPSGGSVHRVRSLSGEGLLGGQGIRVLAQAPKPGASLDRLTRQFLLACADPDDDFAIARSFLVPGERASWRPTAHVTVYDGDPADVQPDVVGSEVRVPVLQTATISNGDFRLTPGETARLRLRAVKVDGEWRFRDVEDGIFLASALLFAFKPVDLYFFDPTLHRLVPDRVFLLASRRQLPDAAIRALLAGPSPWLRDAVRTAVPAGTRLRSPAEVRSGVLAVDLVTSGRGASRAMLAGQVLWTAAQLPEVSGVRLRINGTAFTSGSGGVASADPDALGYDPGGLSPSAPAYYVVASGGRGELRGTESGQWAFAGPNGPLRYPAVSLDRVVAAGLGCAARGCTELYLGRLAEARLVRRLAPGGTLTQPTFSAVDGTAWTAENRPRAAPRLWSVGVDRRPTTVAAPELRAKVVAMRLSRDGTRVAFITDGREGRGVLIAVVVRAGSRVTVRDLRPVAPSLVGAVDLAWADAGHLVVLARSARVAGSVTPYRVRADGSEAPQPILGTALRGQPVSVAAAPEHRLLVASRGVAAGETTQILQLENQTWSVLAPGTDPVYPG
jgi:hypothetical protein